MVFRFGNVEIRGFSLSHQRLGSIEEAQRRIQERPGNRHPVHQQVGLVQMQPARPHDDYGHIVGVKLVDFGFARRARFGVSEGAIRRAL